jgi:ubiquinone/menaquinone biosynthesis C-methylase UbiE
VLRGVRPTARVAIPLALIAVAAAPATPRAVRVVALVMLVGFWTVVYVVYRRGGRAQTQREFEALRRVKWEVFWRHYNERVPTIEEEFEIWGPYHAHRHRMRYDLVAGSVRRHLPRGGRVLDVGCGSAMVADRIADLDVHYVGMDFGAPHILYAATKFSSAKGSLLLSFARGDAAGLPFAAGTFDVVVMSEVIEHLIRPELAVWEVARVLRPGGVFVMTTNNASEVPLRSPLSHLFAWIEKAVGASVPRLISLRPWVWPEKVHSDLLPEGSGDVYLPHTHHIAAETKSMFGAAGLRTFRWRTFEFPPPHSRIARRLSRWGTAGRVTADVFEAVAHILPLVRRLGTHLFMESRKTSEPVAPRPPAAVWPGPFSDGSDELSARAGLPEQRV